MEKWCLYIVECSDKSLYCGITTSIEKRIVAHNSGRGAKYTRSRRPVKVIHNEEFETHKDAAKREIEVKGLTREKKLDLIKYRKDY